ncbi:rhodanese-like domain-containing protein [uncultured Clostridium sp.]|uniref:rhodanese-like domain-containing protein n=1 Tax=uncultured Clostridium sp. TaxID=59620 RepID=UPI003217AE28
MRKISAEELKRKMGSDENLVILDVRDDQAYKEGHIEGAILMSVSDVSHDIEDIVQDKDTTVCVYCYSGNKSARAAMMLEYLEYTNVCDLGGITNWSYELKK